MEEAIMYIAFNRNEDGLVSPDEINVSLINKKTFLNRIFCILLYRKQNYIYSILFIKND